MEKLSAPETRPGECVTGSVEQTGERVEGARVLPRKVGAVPEKCLCIGRGLNRLKMTGRGTSSAGRCTKSVRWNVDGVGPWQIV